jgi:ketosteroid isomerase-like protein
MSQENVEIMHRAFDLFNRGDGDSFDEVFTTDSEWRPAYLGGGLMEGAVFRGIDGMREFLTLQAETWESVAAEAGEVRDLGDRVLVEVQLRGIGRTGGVPVDRITWNVFEFRDGKIAVGKVYTAKAEALAAVGLSE